MRIRLVGPFHVYSVAHPDALEQILVTNSRNYVRGRLFEFMRRGLGNGLLVSDGELHRAHRRVVQPSLQQRCVSRYLDIMIEHANRMLLEWQRFEDRPIDVFDQLTWCAMLIIGKVIFGVDLSEEARRLRQALKDGSLAIHLAAKEPFLLPSWVPTRTNLRFRRPVREIDAALFYMIGERRRRGVDSNDDILSLLLKAQQEGVEGVDRPMTDRAVRDELITLFGAGHETTAAVLTWTLYLLAKNQDVEARLHDELDSILAGRFPTLADLPRLDYTRRVVCESMRIIPPVPATGRMSLEDDVILGHFLPRNARVFLSNWPVHHDPRWYPRPEVFDPDRFTPEAVSSRPRFAYFPFGGGTHLCVGKPFSELAAVVLLASIAQRYRLRLAPGQEAELAESMTIQPKGGLPMRLERRS